MPGRVVQVNVHNTDVVKSYAIDPSLFCETFDWSPQYSLKDIIESFFQD